MQIGIVGLPLSGKTTLFQTLAHTHLDEAAMHRQQANIVTVKVPDPRVDALAEVFKPRKKSYTSIEFVDVVGLKKGDRDSTQFTQGFLANVKTNDALIHVVRRWDDPQYPHPEGSLDPVRDIRILETEFILSDLSMIENRIERIRKQLLKAKDERLVYELHILEKGKVWLEEERPLRTLSLDPTEKKVVKGFQFLSEKPLLALLNMQDDDIGEHDAAVEAVRRAYDGSGLEVDAFFGKIEMELAQLPDEDAEAFMAEYGIKESALSRIIASAYRSLGLISFLTCGDEECRAWTLRDGASVHEAAGVIHTDLMQRFIRAEVVHFDDFMRYGSIAACKEHGHWRLEGKEYIVRDGDIILIRHN
ncbi:MAG: redox-regulated ATPase YchF [Bacteroidota bacterium]|nr:redox-regulated ATPase YchF [Bacteroidota bacterium]